MRPIIALRFSTSTNFTAFAWDRVQETGLTRLQSTRQRVQRTQLYITPITGTSIHALASRGLLASFTERLSFDRALASTTAPPRTTISMPDWKATDSPPSPTSLTVLLFSRPITSLSRTYVASPPPPNTHPATSH